MAIVAEGTGYSVQHTSRILLGHRPQPLVLAWAAGAAGQPISEAWDGERVPVPVRRAHAAGIKRRAIDAGALWEQWKAEHPAKRPVWRAVARPGRAHTPSPTTRGGM